MQLSCLARAVLRGVMLCALWCATTFPTGAQVPHLLGYQGYLTNPSTGAPLSGSLTMIFSLYTAASGGTAVYTETQNVNVTSGTFGVEIGAVTPFPPGLTFTVPYFLGIRIGSDAEMTPRQPLVASPYAMRAAGVDASAALPAVQLTGTITGSQIGSAAVSLANLNASGAALGKYLATDGSVMAWVNPPGVQSVSAGAGLTGGGVGQSNVVMAVANAGVTQGMLSASGGTPGQVLSTNGSSLQWITPAGGSVTSVGATPGGGLATLPAPGITSTGTIGITAGGVQTAMLADGAVTAAKLAPSQALPACSEGQAVRRIGSGWVCYNLPPLLRGVPGGSGGDYGLAVGADGLPVIVTAGPLVYLSKCLDANCVNASTSLISGTGYQPSLAIGADGNPVIAYFGTSLNLFVAKCVDAACAAAPTITIVDPSTIQYPSIAIGTDSIPVIAYVNSSTNKLMVAKCANAACTSTPTISLVDIAGIAPTAIAIGAGGKPIIAYSAVGMRIATCQNASCSALPTPPTLVTLDPAGGGTPSIAIPADTYPIVAYGSGVRKCFTVDCSGGSKLVPFAPAPTGIAIGSNGLPLVLLNGTAVAACSIPDCSESTKSVTADLGAVGTGRITVPPDGYPVILYGGNASFARCSNPTCAYP